MASVNVYGDPVMTTPALRQYQGSPLIPCRFEIARAFRPDQLKEQVITIDEYTVTLPFDMPVETDDVINDAAGNLYKTKRLSDASEWDAYKEILVTRVSFNDE